MITRFDNRMFGFRNFTKVFNAIVIYFISYKLPMFVMIDRLEVLYRLNIREMYIQLENVKIAFLTLDLGLIYYLLEVIDWLGQYFCLGHENINVNKDTLFEYDTKYSFEDRLDNLNSFLYSYKTEALLE